jgi:putative peptidoglycan lipid II flippase
MFRITSVKSPRGVSFALTALSLASKALGYARTLFVAWAFGTSAGMDSYHLASGIIALFSGSAGSAIENSVLPELVRLREKTGDAKACRSLVAFVSCSVLAIAASLAAILMAFPGTLIRALASGFDSERLLIGSNMLRWLAPFAFITIYRPILDIWAIFSERYTLNSLISTLFNFVAIPALALSIPLIGAYGVAFSMSAGHAIVFALFLFAMRGVPTMWRARGVAWGCVRRIGQNSAYMTVILAANALLTIVDRHFASGLPTGSVAAISYATIVTGFVMTFANTPMAYFLSMVSKSAATNEAESLATIKNALALAMAYHIPLSAFMSSAARPIVSVIFGWGTFDAGSVSATSICLAAYSVGFTFSMASNLMYRYAMALRRLRATTMLSYVLVALNAVLDWAFVDRWGLLGLAAATSLTQIIGFALYYLVILDAPLGGFFADTGFFAQLAISGALALFAKLAAPYGTVCQLAASGAMFSAYMLLAERFGLMRGVSPGWRPRQLARFALSAAKSYLKSLKSQ